MQLRACSLLHPQVRFWVDQIQQHEENCLIAIVGTKLDLLESKERGVSQAAVKSYAAQIHAKCYETSALSGSGVSTPFVDLVADWAKAPRKEIVPASTGIVAPTVNLNAKNVQPDGGGGGKGCCK